MTHSPPIPPGNLSPYPIAEPPHPHGADPAPRLKTGVPARSSSMLVGAALAAAAIGAIAFWRSRDTWAASGTAKLSGKRGGTKPSGKRQRSTKA